MQSRSSVVPQLFSLGHFAPPLYFMKESSEELIAQINESQEKIVDLAKEEKSQSAAAIILQEEKEPNPYHIFQCVQSASSCTSQIHAEYSKIYVATSKLSEIASRRIERQTRSLLFLTWALLIFTIILAIPILPVFLKYIGIIHE